MEIEEEEQELDPVYVVKNIDNEDISVLSKEKAVTALSAQYAKENKLENISTLLTTIRPFLLELPKAKSAKLVRTIIDDATTIEGQLDEQVKLVEDCLKWSIDVKRAFLRQRLQLKYAYLLYKKSKYQEALKEIHSLCYEIKKLEDKPLLVEIFLIESYIHYALHNVPKSKAALTTARSTASSIYLSPKLQCDIDMQAGIIQASDNNDYKTGFSYFFEAYEGYDNMKDKDKALKALKYMLLCKILSGSAGDVPGLIQSKYAVKYAGSDLDGMNEAAKAYKNRSLKEFDVVMEKYKEELQGDPLIAEHLGLFKEQLLEQNFIRLVEPFSCVEISHIAELINLPLNFVERKISQMILDKKIYGILDQGKGYLMIYDEEKSDRILEQASEILTETDKLIDVLQEKAEALH